MSDDAGDIYTNTGDPGTDADVSDGGGLVSDQDQTTLDGMTGEYADGPAVYDASGEDPADAYSAVSPSGDGHVGVDYDGIQFDAGQATLDVTGDGVADTAVQDHGYQVEYYVDSTGDGVADELTITDAEGGLVSQEVVDPATGEWIDVTGQSGG